MTDFTFLHAADLHLDSPLRGLDAGAPAARIRGATREARVRLVDLALERRVPFVLLAGDLYDGDARDWRTGQVLVQPLARLTREKIEIVAISGNHDADQVLTRKMPVPGMLRSGKAVLHTACGVGGHEHDAPCTIALSLLKKQQPTKFC